MFLGLLISLLFLFHLCLSVRPHFQQIHSLHHNYNQTHHRNQKQFFYSSANHSSIFLQTTSGDAPKTALFISTVQKLCDESKTANEYFNCLQSNVKSKTLPDLLQEIQKKLLFEIGSNSNPKKVFIEGLGPIGGNVALNARLNDDDVYIVERHDIFNENQAFTLYPDSIEILIKLGFDYSDYGFCKSSLQYIYLFLLALFETKIHYYPYEVIGWNENTKEVICLNWNRASTRTSQRLALETEGWYHKDHTTWKQIISSNPLWWEESKVKSIATLHSIPTDLILAAGGPNSAFHYLIPGLQTAFNAGPKNKLITTVAIILKLPIFGDPEEPMNSQDFQELDDKIMKWKFPSKGEIHQAKFVPRRAYDNLLPNEVWIERLFTVEELTTIWKDPGIPELFTGKSDTTLSDFLSHIVHSNLHHIINYASENGNPRTKLLGKILISFDDLMKAPIGLDVAQTNIDGFLVSNRIVPKENLVSKLPGNPKQIKVIFLGDSFHESLFLKGNGVLMHMLEIIGDEDNFPGLPTINQILDDDEKVLNKWIEGVYPFGLNYLKDFNVVL